VHGVHAVLERCTQPTVRAAVDRLCAELASKHEPVYELLQRLDRNGDGRLSRDELRHGLRGLGVSLLPPELDGALGAFDKNHDGIVDYAELHSLLSKHRAGETSAEPGSDDFAVMDLRFKSVPPANSQSLSPHTLTSCPAGTRFACCAMPAAQSQLNPHVCGKYSTVVGTRAGSGATTQ
jgi:hypothetical protein